MSRSVKIMLILFAILIVGLLLLVGINYIILTSEGWTKMNVQDSVALDAAELQELDVWTDVADISVVVGEPARVEYDVRGYMKKDVQPLSVVGERGITTIRTDDQSPPSIFGIFSGNSMRMTIYLPEAQMQRLSVCSMVGDVSVEGIVSSAVEGKAYVGDLCLKGMRTDSVRMESKVGDTTFSGDVKKALTADVATGDLLVTLPQSITGFSLDSTTDVGEILCEFPLNTTSQNQNGAGQSLRATNGDASVRIHLSTDVGDIHINAEKV